MGEHSNLCIYEAHLADKWADAIIIIPDSAGSLVELGLFTLRHKIHPKIMVLFNTQHPATENSYINQGPRLDYKLGDAVVEDVEYTELDTVWNLVDDFLKKIKVKVLSDKL